MSQSQKPIYLPLLTLSLAPLPSAPITGAASALLPPTRDSQVRPLGLGGFQHDVVEGGEGSPPSRRVAAGVHGCGIGEDLPRRGGATFRGAGGAGDQAGRARAGSEASGGARARARRLHQPLGLAGELPILDPRPSHAVNRIVMDFVCLFLRPYEIVPV
jgi:hypothetical protein